MKSIKKLYFILAAFLLFIGACINPEDVTPVQEGGVLLSIENTSGKFLGLPETDAFLPLDVALDYELYIPNGITADVASYSIVKRYNTTGVVQNDAGEDSTVVVSGDWIVVASVTELPYVLAYTTEAEFYDGLNITSADLKVGDTFDFWVKVIKNDGTEYFPADSYGMFSVTVNCLSDLAATYVLDGLYTRTSAGIVNQPFHKDAEVIYEVAPGEYLTSSSGHWVNPGDLAPGDDGFYFQDVCGSITMKEQYLGGYWANILSGTGTVDGATGNLHFEYTVCYGGDCREYVADYVLVTKGAFFKDKIEAQNIQANNVK
ncbi:MAG: hypothetical protein L3J35_08765 [Bacteroidales bacterium]|nr:hypothetical protein [Bacteroidales bacterium]